MAKVTVRKSDVEGFYVGTAGDFRVNIDKTEKKSLRSIDFVLLGLGACTIGTVGHYLQRKGLPSDCVDVELSADFDQQANVYKDFIVTLHIANEISAEIRKTIANIAKTCRVHRTLASGPQISVVIGDR